ncbi:hypothetical protein MMC28_002868, partial [Mycoblastus sanguinarius]|nr:hypothetical protein [Mycoblastus sanguinarius]
LPPATARAIVDQERWGVDGLKHALDITSPPHRNALQKGISNGPAEYFHDNPSDSKQKYRSQFAPAIKSLLGLHKPGQSQQSSTEIIREGEEGVQERRIA